MASMEANSTNHSYLETLPAELKLMILCQMDDENTLLNLITACPIYTTIELEKRTEILTAIAINHVIRNGYDPFGNHDVFALSLHEGLGFRDGCWDAISNFHILCQQHRITKSTAPLKIPVEICRCVLEIADAVGWRVVEKIEDLPVESDGQPDWSRIFGFRYRAGGEEVGQWFLGPRGEYSTEYLYGEPVSGHGSLIYYSAFFAPRMAHYAESAKREIISTIRNMDWSTYPGLDWDDES